MSGEIYLDGTVTPTSAAPIANDTDLMGGWRQVPDAAARNAIPASRRKWLMIVQQQDTGGLYSLVATPPYAYDDTDWFLARGLALYWVVAPNPAMPPPGPLTEYLPATNLDVAVDLTAPLVTGINLRLDPACAPGCTMFIKDSKRVCSTKNIIIYDDGGALIEQFGGGTGANLVINTDGQSVTLRKDFGEWVII